MRERLRILTWQEHGNYLHYLSYCPHDFFVVTGSSGLPGEPVRPGLGGSMPWRANLREIAASDVRHAHFDVVLYQSRSAWEDDRLLLLSPGQRRVPQVVLEHDPPRAHPTDTRHWADEDQVLLVQVTAFNALMWQATRATVRVVERGVAVPAQVGYRGTRGAGIVVVNHLVRRGRRLGADLFCAARAAVPLDLVGMAATECGGLGEVPNALLPQFLADYRFYFHPVRWTSLGLALIEAMQVGLPVVAVATAGIPGVIHNGYNGYADIRPERLVEVMRVLLREPGLAREWGAAARRMARERFAIGRFVRDWQAVLREAAG